MRLKFFKKIMEKPINDTLISAYSVYCKALSPFIDKSIIPTFEEFCKLVNDDLKSLYDFNSSVKC